VALVPVVGDVQKASFEADVDERRLHPEAPDDAAEIDVADDAAARRPFDMQFLDDPCSTIATRVPAGELMRNSIMGTREMGNGNRRRCSSRDLRIAHRGLARIGGS